VAAAGDRKRYIGVVVCGRDPHPVTIESEFLQQGPPLVIRQLDGRLRVEVQQVEHGVSDRDGGQEARAGRADVDTALEPGEGRQRRGRVNGD
jgi:hypothetical protein